MALVFRPRRGMKSTMAGDKASLVLESGELFLEYPDTGVGTGASRFKIGDGTTEYSDLPYATPFIFTIQKNGSTVNPNANGVVNLTIGTGDVSGLQTALDGKLSTTGNAASASKLQTARAITLAGDVTGTANFDGSAGITINTTVKDDSHSHTIANVDGLQTALNGKLSTTGNAASASKWATARNINGLSIDGTANRVNFGTCSTAAGTAAKTVDCAGFALVTGAEITVKFTVTNTAGSPTLNVNNTGAKAIQYRGAAISAGALAANRVYTFRYDGTNYLLVGDLDSNTTYSLSSFGVTATAAELNTLDGITATTAELNKMHGVTATTAELNYVDGVTSNIQTQLNGKAASNHSHAFSAITGTLDASKLSGTIDIARLPAAALERCVVVANDAARFDLTTANVQLGDTVKVTATNMMYMVVDTAELDNAAGYEAYTASVAWSNITGKPSSFPPSSHTHNYAGSSSAGGAANSAVKLQTARTISLGGDASGSTTFDGSGNVTINVSIKDDSHNHTIANVDGLQTALDGKAASSHTHKYAGSSSAGGAANSANQINSSGLVGANLNDYQTAGKFYYGGGSNNCTNKPSGVNAFGMYVIKTASGYTTQILYDTENHMWMRTYGDSAWTSWVEVYTSANKPTASEIGAAASSHTHNYAGSSSAGGAANSAVKLQTARAITLSGDVNGTANFDGSAGITINTTVKDDSHNHTIANVDGLQTALNGKLSTGGTAAAATKLATARNINGLTFDGTANRVNYGSCSTAAGTAAKTVACTGFALITGAEITVKFTVTNSAANPTLNVNNTGAKAIYYRGAAISAGYLAANRTYTFRYNGTQYELVGDIDTSKTYSLSSFGITATAAELNKLDGVTATAKELNYVDGVTSNIQTQLNGKAASSHTHSGTQVTGLTASRALVSNSSGQVAVSAVTSTELGYLDGVTSSVQTQLNSKLPQIIGYYGSDASGSNGWYKVCTVSQSGNSDYSINLLFTQSFYRQATGILYVHTRCNNTTKITLQSLKWMYRMGFSAGDVKVVTGTNTWSLYVQQTASQYGRIQVQVLSKSGTSSDTTFTLSSNTTKETTTPGGTAATDGATVNSANSAAKLSTARNIALSGDVTGSVNFDGSANVTLTATVKDDSHNHTIANIDNLQSTLNGKAPSSHTHTTSQVSGLGAAATKAVTDSTSAAAIGTGSNLVTERDVYYGLPKINNGHSYTSNTNIFAPTTGGSSGQVLRSNGSTATPTWANAADLISTLDCGDEG